MIPATVPGSAVVWLRFPEWVQNPDQPGNPEPRWAVQLDGQTVQHCVTRVEAESYAALLRDVVADVDAGRAVVL